MSCCAAGLAAAAGERVIHTRIAARYQTPDKWKSVGQICTSVLPFLLLWYVMLRSLEVSYWLTLALAFPAAGFLVRTFIIQHDCGHGSFFRSKKANDRLGAVCGVLTLVPYQYWRKTHAIHHAHASNLQGRGVGDVETLTVTEYGERSRFGRLKYRLYRHPVVMLVLAPAFLFVVGQRFPSPGYRGSRRERASIWGTTAAIAALAALLCWILGPRAFLMVQLPITVLACTAGTWLFYVQHQFEDTYWADEKDWDYGLAALRGSSYYRLPRVLQWFSGNIGFHHIHHLSPRIPNYRLERCHQENPEFQQVSTLTLRSSLKSLGLALWDEEAGKLVGFREAARAKAARAAGAMENPRRAIGA